MSDQWKILFSSSPSDFVDNVSSPKELPLEWNKENLGNVGLVTPKYSLEDTSDNVDAEIDFLIEQLISSESELSPPNRDKDTTSTKFFNNHVLCPIFSTRNTPLPTKG